MKRKEFILSSLKIEKYLRNKALRHPWRLSGDIEGDIEKAVVIPSLAEGDSLFKVLQSLARNPSAHLCRTLIVVVVNHREDAPTHEKCRNRNDLKRLASEEVPACLRLAVVDAASPGYEMSAGNGGVGLARRIGMDLVLPHLKDSPSHPAYLACLDADTLVEPGYLAALTNHFTRHREGGAVLHFRHRPGKTPAEEAAIIRYELFLRHYVLGLSLAKSPYAFHTVGSAMACTAGAYVRADGVPLRQAAEDFYFLQKLAKTDGVRTVGNTTVFPSPRASARVPFGTGRAVSRMIAGEEEILFYDPACFSVLKNWLALVREHPDSRTERLQKLSVEISPHLASFLNAIGFFSIWPRLHANHAGPEARLKAFHIWFDGLKTRKLIHALSAGPFPRTSSGAALSRLLEEAGASLPENPAEQLDLLRRLQETGGMEGLQENKPLALNPGIL